MLGIPPRSFGIPGTQEAALDAGVVLIMITLTEGADARVRIISSRDSPPPGEPAPGTAG